MALMKTADLAGKGSAGRPAPVTSAPAPAAAFTRRSSGRQRARQEKAAERIGAATEELASGVTEASAAAEELRRALEQISAAAEEAAGAAQESQTAVASLGAIFAQAREQAGQSRGLTVALQANLTELGTQIDALVSSVNDNTSRQRRSSEVVASLESQAANIGEITRAVGEISEQTNLLALNAAIEAARAGEHGRGFAVVAEEVRAFAETSEASARDVQGLTDEIGTNLRAIVAHIGAAAARASAEAEAGVRVVDSLLTIRADMRALADGADTILAATIDAEGGALQAQRGAEQIASAAEEQSAAAQQAQQAVEQQSTSLDESARTAQALAVLAEALQGADGVMAGASQVSAAAEQLSATVQELSSAAVEILAALDQISRGAAGQAAATQQSTAAMAQIERAAAATRAVAALSADRTAQLGPQLSDNRAAVEALIRSVASTLQETRAVVALVATLEIAIRRIEKIVDRIAIVAVQTNMLAVSGSVEAARAGDHGRGFAVVSADVRNLARESADNTDRIRDVVRAIQDQVAVVRRDLEQNAAVSQADIARNESILRRFTNLDGDMGAIRTGAADILSGADAVLVAVRQVLAGTTQAAASAEETSKAAAEAATAARQQAQGAEGLAAAIEEIASLADELQIAES